MQPRNTLQNWHLKKQKKLRNFKRLYLKSYGEFRVKTNIFRKFIQNRVVFARSIHVGTRQGAPPSTSPGAAASRLWGSKS